MLDIKLLVTGCGRSGTGYVASLLTSNGLDCGHESVFDVFGSKTGCPHLAESSWYGAPFIPLLPDCAKIVHLVRDPTAVATSFSRIGLFDDTIFRHWTYGFGMKKFSEMKFLFGEAYPRFRFTVAHRQFLKRHTHTFSESSPYLRGLRYWYDWNLKIERFADKNRVQYLRLNIEKIDKQIVFLEDFLEKRFTQRTLSRYNRNEKPFYRPPENENGGTPLPRVTLDLAKKYGYFANTNLSAGFGAV